MVSGVDLVVVEVESHCQQSDENIVSVEMVHGKDFC